MTPPLDRLRQIAAIRRELDDEESAIITALETTQPAPPSAPARRQGRLINVSVAATIARKGTGWVYKNAPRYGFGWRIASGSWVVDESLLRAFLHSASEKSEKCEEREAKTIPLLTGPAYLQITTKD